MDRGGFPRSALDYGRNTHMNLKRIKRGITVNSSSLLDGYQARKIIGRGDQLAHRVKQLRENNERLEDDINMKECAVAELETTVVKKDQTIIYLESECRQKDSTINDLTSNRDDLKGQFRSTKSELKDRTKDCQDLTVEVESLNQSLKKTKNDLHRTSKHAEVLTTNLASTENEVKQVKADIKSKNATIKDLEQKISELKRKIKEKDVTIVDLEEKLKEKELAVTRFEKQNRELERLVEKKNTDLRSSHEREHDLEQTLKTRDHKIKCLEVESTGLKGEIGQKTADVNSLESDQKKTTMELTKCSELLKIAEGERETYKSALEKVQERLSQNGSLVASLGTEKNELENRLGECNLSIQKMQMTIGQLEEKLKAKEGLDNVAGELELTATENSKLEKASKKLKKNLEEKESIVLRLEQELDRMKKGGATPRTPSSAWFDEETNQALLSQIAEIRNEITLVVQVTNANDAGERVVSEKMVMLGEKASSLQKDMKNYFEGLANSTEND